jgi:hypothetical protein
MKNILNPLLHTVRKHSVLTEIVLVGFAVIAFVLSLMLGLPNPDVPDPVRATQAQVSATAPGNSDPAGS